MKTSNNKEIKCLRCDVSEFVKEVEKESLEDENKVNYECKRCNYKFWITKKVKELK